MHLLMMNNWHGLWGHFTLILDWKASIETDDQYSKTDKAGI